MELTIFLFDFSTGHKPLKHFQSRFRQRERYNKRRLNKVDNFNVVVVDVDVKVASTDAVPDVYADCQSAGAPSLRRSRLVLFFKDG